MTCGENSSSEFLQSLEGSFCTNLRDLKSTKQNIFQENNKSTVINMVLIKERKRVIEESRENKSKIIL